MSTTGYLRYSLFEIYLQYPEALQGMYAPSGVVLERKWRYVVAPDTNRPFSVRITDLKRLTQKHLPSSASSTLMSATWVYFIRHVKRCSFFFVYVLGEILRKGDFQYICSPRSVTSEHCV